MGGMRIGAGGSQDWIGAGGHADGRWGSGWGMRITDEGAVHTRLGGWVARVLELGARDIG